MTDRQTPKAKLTNEQYVALLRQIRKIHKELNQMSAMIGDIEADRQSKDKDDGCYELFKIDYAIRYGKQNINEMEEMIGDLIE